MRTVGIEEELLVVDIDSRTTVPRAPELLAVPGLRRRSTLDRELFRHQVELQTEPATDLADLLPQLREHRRLVAEAGAGLGLGVAASGTSPTPVDVRLTDDDRYRALVDEFGAIGWGGGTCGLHVHVGVGSDEEAVAVVDGISPWLSTLVALSANSPFADGHDTGYASWRTVQWGRWPTAGPTAPFGSVAAYRETCRALVAAGAAHDEHALYFDARLAADYPTVEVRVADVPTDPRDAVLVAALARGLVETEARGASSPAASSGRVRSGRPELVRAGRWRAARHGLAGDLLDPRHERSAPAAEVVAALVAHVHDALVDAGDFDLVRDGTARLLRDGTGAERQRTAHDDRGDVHDVVDDLVRRTAAG